MLNLLRQPRRDGYPDDFLSARLRGKRRKLLSMSSGTGSASREQMQEDYREVYEMMRPPRRRKFAPYFLLSELRNLHVMLRAVTGTDEQLLQRYCRTSLLNQQFLKQVSTCEQLSGLFDLLTGWFNAFLPDEPIAELFSRGGGRLVEESLSDGLLRWLAANRLAPVLADYVADQVDLRNLLTAGRALRWELDEVPLLAGGGEISRQLAEASEREGRKGFAAVVGRFSGGDGGDLALLESEMLSRLSHRIGLAGRDPLGDGLVVDYLWRRYLACRSAGLRLRAGDEITAWEGVA